jgi:7-carboxy-7-deazaguanine synthase
MIIPQLCGVKMNTQKPEPLVPSDGETLDIIEYFHTLQGEGPFTGWPAIFIRLAGCNLQCPACDTIYTGAGRTKIKTGDLFNEVLVKLIGQHPETKLIVITGGEPLRQNISPLVGAFIDCDYKVQVETNGVFAFGADLLHYLESGDLTLVVSPKTSRISPFTAERASCFKYVLRSGEVSEEDGLPLRALGHKASPQVARPPRGWKGRIFVNPQDDKADLQNRANLLTARDSALKHGYVLGVQLHKLIDLP